MLHNPIIIVSWAEFICNAKWIVILAGYLEKQLSMLNKDIHAYQTSWAEFIVMLADYLKTPT